MGRNGMPKVKPCTPGSGRAIRNLYAVVLVGGKGKRLRPLSTDEMPKAFLSVTGNRKSMFANTLRRVGLLVPESRIIVVANAAHEKLVRRDFPSIREENLILEPVSRNTGPAVAIAVRAVYGRDRDAVIAVLPTDHYIRNEEKQLRCAEVGVEFLNNHKDAIVVFGIHPTFPSTEYGYVKVGRKALKVGGTCDKKIVEVARVERFVEKPDADTAAKYLESGGYLWNSGAFLFTAKAFLGALRKYAPAIWRRLKDASSAREYEKMPDISLDYAVMEKARKIYCVKGSYGWSDVGSFAALRKVLVIESRRFVEKEGRITKIL